VSTYGEPHGSRTTVAERLRVHPWTLAFAILTVIGIAAGLVYWQDASRLWLVVAAIGATAIAILASTVETISRGMGLLTRSRAVAGQVNGQAAEQRAGASPG
jgi:hypothetical protein